jgi:hypothetical protein
MMRVVYPANAGFGDGCGRRDDTAREQVDLVVHTPGECWLALVGYGVLWRVPGGQCLGAAYFRRGERSSSVGGSWGSVRAGVIRYCSRPCVLTESREKLLRFVGAEPDHKLHKLGVQLCVGRSGEVATRRSRCCSRLHRSTHCLRSRARRVHLGQRFSHLS